jgi:three-Cys-motif partner protein
MTLDQLPQLNDDGLELPEVGQWAETKYGLIATYSEMFSTAMKGKWETRVYIDLFAAAGRARIKGTSRIVSTSSMLALQVKHPFDRYVLCELKPKLLSALETRARRDAPGCDLRCVLGDCNVNVHQILKQIPTGSRGHGVLSFCVADPSNLASLRFTTIRALTARYVDFLVLIPSAMEARRFSQAYFDPDNTVISDFLGDPRWRQRWAQVAAGPGPHDFGAFVIDRFGCAMRELGYRYPGPSDTVPVKDKHLLLYHLAFFSRHPRGTDFWRKAKRHSIDQLGLPLSGE